MASPMIAPFNGGKDGERHMPGLATFSYQPLIGRSADLLKPPVRNAQVRQDGTGWATIVNGEQEIGSQVRAAGFLAGLDKFAILGGNAARGLRLNACLAA